ncbi:hypothetical protein IW261DRAFT_1568805 [Armillaria novae-zelandiae]|uniref:Uncharacterized protein n=1 Tax=Armillaria novae-zelandiae TaxID=153914 RepID=A0AA39NZ75_9AGAR|nr:hypothetical protein IW261DRAFT_1568805 [Armillaria novae-zelandiae]
MSSMLSLILLVPLVYAVNVTHYAPCSTNINNLTYVLNGTTNALGIYNTSMMPDSEYGTTTGAICLMFASENTLQNSLLEIHH